ncbi:hypothetical protein [Streptomyces sp. 8N616]|uniref:hypothetical protein n=1 Tax=Streptomyces sp. 8N616 TaxID=3457414 RepID=UPI003FD5F9B3
MTSGQLRRYGKAILREIELPQPFFVTALCDAIAMQRGRPLYLHPLPAESGPDIPSGVWIATETADHIFYEEQTSAFHRDHIILHEIGHMLCGHSMPHLADESGLSPGRDQTDPDVVRGALKRTSYTTEQERQAEMVASLILEKSSRMRDKPSSKHDRWLGSALGVIDD